MLGATQYNQTASRTTLGELREGVSGHPYQVILYLQEVITRRARNHIDDNGVAAGDQSARRNVNRVQDVLYVREHGQAFLED